MDFSPVVEYRNNVWPGRSFTGTIDEIKLKIEGYIKGLQNEGVIATAKHFPGGSMILDPHRMDIFQHTDKDELKLFDAAISAGVKAIMIGQTIAEKEINPNRYPATISYETIKHLRSKFNGLIVSDDIDMWGLKDFPPKKDYYERIYVKIISAGNDIILHTHPILLTNPFASLYKRILSGITSLERAVNNGLISEERINQSVKRILKLKGYKVI
jgi:beta-N-acetylhexosaminidase